MPTLTHTMNVRHFPSFADWPTEAAGRDPQTYSDRITSIVDSLCQQQQQTASPEIRAMINLALSAYAPPSDEIRSAWAG